MQNAVELVYQALNGDQVLINSMGGKKVVKNQNWNRIYKIPNAPYPEELPRITMFEVVNSDEVSADNVSLYSDVNIRIDIWTKDSDIIFSIVKEIKKVLKGTFSLCLINAGETMWESDTNIYHKPINLFLYLEQESEI